MSQAFGKSQNQKTKRGKSENLNFQDNGNPEFSFSENMDGQLFKDLEDVKPQKIRQEQWNFGRMQKSYYDERYKEFLGGRNTQAIESCPMAEMYIGVVYKGRYEKFQVNDIEIRRHDRMQFVTGVYTQSTGVANYDVGSCFIARLSTRGDYERGSFLYMNTVHDSYCYNLALIPRVNYLVAVGFVNNNVVNKNKALIFLADQDLNQKALKVWTNTNDAYNTVAGDIESVATDVQVAEADGSIYITGYIKNSFSRGVQTTTQNCFVMRVDTELNLIYAKSFGDKLQSSSVLSCYSLQITRNAEFMYFGGYQTYGGVQRLFFSKSNGNGDFMVTTAVAPSGTDTFSLSRILLDKGNAFSGTSDKLYFCGMLTYGGSTNSDFMYGYITSGDVETYLNETGAPLQNSLIKVNKIYTYGTSDIEQNVDCAISEDNKNMMAVFSTKYHKSFTSSRIWTWPDDTVGAGKGLSPSYYYTSGEDPFTIQSGGCGSSYHQQNFGNNYNDMKNFIDNPSGSVADQLASIRNNCEDPITQSILTYAAVYDKQIFSWHQCTNYWWAYSAIDDCQINYIRVTPFCDTVQNDNDWMYTCGGGTSGYRSEASSCDIFLGYANTQRPWYTQNCWRQEQRRNIYIDTFSGANDYMRQYMFCYDSDTNPTTCTEDDEYFLNFEQDCEPTGQSYYSIFVARFTLTDISSATHVTNNPEIAAYMGDVNGDFNSYSIALDQYGYVYVHGISSASGFGANPSPSATQFDYTWVHVKTHWELAGEYEFNYINEILQGGTVYYREAGVTMGTSTGSSWKQWYGRSSDYANERPPTFIGKKFTVPKKFKNVVSPQPAAEQVTFLAEYHDSVTHLARVSNPQAKSYMMNEELYEQSTFGFSFTYSSIAANSFIWGYSYAKSAKAEDIRIYVDSSTQTLTTENISFNVPHICIDSLFNAAGIWDQNFYREYINGKNSWKVGTTTAPTYFLIKQDGYYSLSSYTGVTRENRELSIEVTGGLNQLVEGLYYFDIRVSTDERYPWDASKKHCLYSKHGFFWNTDQFNSRDYTYMRRFETSYRVRILVDQESVDAPKNIRNIEDIFPIVGLKQEFQLNSAGGVSKYFEGSCDRYFAKQQKLKITNAASMIFNTEQLPHWIKFFERNATFQFYPIIYSPHRIISLELSCCNLIEQCATQTFHVNVQNTPPLNDFAQTNTYVLQYDAVDLIGQQFQWEMRNTYFYDLDIASDILNTSNYNLNDLANQRTDHTVDMDFTDATTTFSNQFRHIKRVGLIFGQGMSTVYGVQLLNYKFRDNFVTTTQQLGYLKVLINRMPTVTSTGTSYKLTQIDPMQFGRTTYFDKWFPFLNNDDLLVFEVDASPWFLDDTTDILTYGLTRSDNTPRPQWIDFDVVNGKMTGFPNQTEQSELLQLKFTVQDQQQGTNKVYKEMLINSQPQARNLYKVIEVGTNRQFAQNVSDLIWDYNGDPISFSLPQSSDQTKLAAYGISLNDATKLLYGKPTLQGTIALIKLRGTDTHGSYVDTYITIKIDDFQPNKRSNVRYPDRQLFEYQRFEFQLDDGQFYDQKDYATLVFFAYDPAESPLPSWLNFMPHTRVFNGIAPKRNTEQVVVIRAMNTITHDSLSVTYRIQIIANPSPRTKFVHMPQDLTILQDSWIDHQVPILMFKDTNENYMPQLEILQVNGAKLPSFLSFNPVNRTLYGKANETGSFRVDFVFKDDQGRKTYSNLRLTVLPVDYSLPTKYYYHFAISGSAFVALLIFLGSVYHTNSLLSQTYKIAENTEKDAQEARKRFGEYREIDIRFKKPQPRALDQIRQARLREIIKLTGGEAGAITARTFDYNFSVDNNQDQTIEYNQLENTMTTMLNKNSDKLFNNYQDRIQDDKPMTTLSQRVSMQQSKLRRNGQKTKIFSM